MNAAVDVPPPGNEILGINSLLLESYTPYVYLYAKRVDS